MNNLLSYCGLVDARITYNSDKDLSINVYKIENLYNSFYFVLMSNIVNKFWTTF